MEFCGFSVALLFTYGFKRSSSHDRSWRLEGNLLLSRLLITLNYYCDVANEWKRIRAVDICHSAGAQRQAVWEAERCSVGNRTVRFKVNPRCESIKLKYVIVSCNCMNFVSWCIVHPFIMFVIWQSKIGTQFEHQTLWQYCDAALIMLYSGMIDSLYQMLGRCFAQQGIPEAQLNDKKGIPIPMLICFMAGICM